MGHQSCYFSTLTCNTIFLSPDSYALQLFLLQSMALNIFLYIETRCTTKSCTKTIFCNRIVKPHWTFYISWNSPMALAYRNWHKIEHIISIHLVISTCPVWYVLNIAKKGHEHTNLYGVWMYQKLWVTKIRNKHCFS